MLTMVCQFLKEGDGWYIKHCYSSKRSDAYKTFDEAVQDFETRFDCRVIIFNGWM